MVPGTGRPYGDGRHNTMQVKEDKESEGCHVMWQIGVQDLPPCENMAEFYLVLCCKKSVVRP
jgi:hypothetical protein